MNRRFNRRQFITRSAAATGAFLVAIPARSQKLSPSARLNIGMIGVANRAGDDLKEVSSENIVALCDIDDRYLDAAKQKYPRAKTYNDFRRLLDQGDIDAIVVGTPDHTHAVAAVAALTVAAVAALSLIAAAAGSAAGPTVAPSSVPLAPVPAARPGTP